MNKRGQNWSLEMIVTSSLFVSFFVVFLTFSFVSNSSDLRDTEFITDSLVQKLLSQGVTTSIVGERNAVDKSKLQDLSDLSYEELAEFLGMDTAFCIILEDDRGNIIPINGTYGLGSTDIQISGVNCAGAIP